MALKCECWPCAFNHQSKHVFYFLLQWLISCNNPVPECKREMSFLPGSAPRPDAISSQPASLTALSLSIKPFMLFDTSQRQSLWGDWWWQHAPLCSGLLLSRKCVKKRPRSVNCNRFCSSLSANSSASDLAHCPQPKHTLYSMCVYFHSIQRWAIANSTRISLTRHNEKKSSLRTMQLIKWR